MRHKSNTIRGRLCHYLAVMSGERDARLYDARRRQQRARCGRIVKWAEAELETEIDIRRRMRLRVQILHASMGLVG